MSAPVPGTTVADATTANAPSLSIPFTSTGKPLIVEVFIGASAGASNRQTFTVKYGGVSLTQIGGFADDGNFCGNSLWKLMAPTPGTANIVIDTSTIGALQIGASAQEWTGLISIGVPVTAGSTTGSTIATSALTPTADEIILGCMGTDDGGAANTIDNGGTKLAEFSDGTHLNSDCGFGSFTYAATGSAITPSWSALGGVGGSIIAVVLTGSGATAAITGTLDNASEADVVAGGKTIVITLTGETFIA